MRKAIQFVRRDDGKGDSSAAFSREPASAARGTHSSAGNAAAVLVDKHWIQNLIPYTVEGDN